MRRLLCIVRLEQIPIADINSIQVGKGLSTETREQYNLPTDSPLESLLRHFIELYNITLIDHFCHNDFNKINTH